ncbi:hypothetical protein R3P38DRAFT_1355559 [Favolaschia claudopus]|uniref:DUF6534 domain-containing protein n=1 Tax=Favolaschia claudopus TaxID=2862362 RepID=A0AAW0DUC2_9AGAR
MSQSYLALPPTSIRMSIGVTAALPLLTGSLLSMFLFGALLVQVYAYHTCFPKDSSVIKGIVLFVFLASTVDRCLNISDVFYWFASSFGDVAGLSHRRYSRFYAAIMGSLVSTIVRLFFAYRIFVIRRTAWPLCILIALIALAHMAGGFTGGILAFIEDSTSKTFNPDDIINIHDHPHIITSYVWLICGVLADILIALSMTILLLRTMVDDTTRNAVNQFIRLVLETNICSAVFTLTTLVLYAALPPSNLACTIPAFALPTLYANTLLVILNNRGILLRARANKQRRMSVLVEQTRETFTDTDTMTLARDSTASYAGRSH